MKKIKFVLAFLPFMLFANEQNSQIANNIIQSSSPNAVNPNDLEKSFYNKLKYQYYNATLLNWIRFNRSQASHEQDNMASKVDLIADIARKDKDNNSSKANSNEIIIVKGYCFISEDVNVGKQPSSIYTNCQTNVGAISMFSNLVSLNDKFSLLANPVYIEKNGYRFLVKKADVLNQARTSYNIATFANDRKIEKIAYQNAMIASDEIKIATNAYLKDYISSRKQQKVEYLNIGDNNQTSHIQPQTITNVEKPLASDYLITAGINIAASLVKTTASIFNRDLPYLYEIKKNSKIWINLEVMKKGEKVQ